MVVLVEITILSLVFLAAEIYHDYRARYVKRQGIDHKGKAPMRGAFFLILPFIFIEGLSLEYFKYLFIGPTLYWPMFNIAYALIVGKQNWYYIDVPDEGEDNSVIDGAYSELSIWFFGYLPAAIVSLLLYYYT